jgi:hypothetical protein
MEATRESHNGSNKGKSQWKQQGKVTIEATMEATRESHNGKQQGKLINSNKGKSQWKQQGKYTREATWKQQEKV